MKHTAVTGLAGILLFFLVSFVPATARADAPYCYNTSSGTPLCQYTGKVRQAYINSGGMILLYFDTALDLSAPSSVGLDGVTNASAAAVFKNDTPDFAKSFYASVLSAQARDATISIQMKSSKYGYLVADRIWIVQ